MIVVIGSPSGRQDDDLVRAGGLASLIAIAAAAHGRSVQLVGRIGDDPAADAVLGDLTRHGVGHVAILRDASRATPIEGGEAAGLPDADRPELDGADVELALRYLIDFTVVVVTGDAVDVMTVVERAASWGEAQVIVVDDAPASGATDRSTDEGGMPGRVRLVPAATESGAAFVERVGAFVAGLDARAAQVRSAR